MRYAILFLDTNVLLDWPQPDEYRLSGRQLTLVVIPEVMQELRGLARSPGRGQAGAALRALAVLEAHARRRGSAVGIPVGRFGTILTIPLGKPSGTGGADAQLVHRARMEQSRRPDALVVVVTRDWGVAELARAERVKSALLRGVANQADLEREVSKHDTSLDIEL